MGSQSRARTLGVDGHTGAQPCVPSLWCEYVKCESVMRIMF